MAFRGMLFLCVVTAACGDDVPRADAAVADSPIIDATVDALPDAPAATEPCKATKGTEYASNMVLCTGPSLDADQCMAEATFCAPGWHLCTASEFLARGGTTMPASNAAWLAACIRENGGTVTTPSDGICSSCAQATASTEVLARGCTNGVYSANGSYVGVLATAGCFGVGPDGVGPQAYWQSMPSQFSWPGAVCCQ